MFEDLRRLFRESVEAFRRELSTRDPEDQIAELLGAMRRELVAARAALPEYEAELGRARAELERERSALAECERRGALAERIADAETARVAAEFADRHRERSGVLARKISVAEAELALRQREAEEMKRRYREAELNRFALLAELRSASAREAMRARLGEEDTGPAGHGEPNAEAIEERLRELKRRMGRE